MNKKNTLYIAILFAYIVVFVSQVSGVYVQADADVSALQAKENAESSVVLREYVDIADSKKTIKSEINLTVNSGNDLKSNNSLKAHLSNGQTAEIKIMPETASQIAIWALNLKVCSQENNCTIVLKESWNRNESRVEYEVSSENRVKVFCIFTVKMKENVMIGAENG